MAEKQIRFTLNGKERRIAVEPYELLLNVLRDRLQLTGTKYGCGIGECGACTVLVDDRPTLSCLTLAVSVNGKSVTTVEGLAGQELHPVQRAFIDNAAAQCGFCTPGLVMAVKSLLDRNPNPTETEVREYLSGHLCRCTGWGAIVKAALACARGADGDSPERRNGAVVSG